MAAVEGGTEVRLLGGFSIRRGGEEVAPSAFRGRLVRTLIRVLVTRRGQFVSHDVLAEALWPDRMPADPIANLKVLVNRARAGLGDPTLIVTAPRGYSFVGGDICRVDAEEFLAAAVQGRRHLSGGDPVGALAVLGPAIDGWGGEPLPEDAYEDWAREYRAMVVRAYLQVVEDAARAALMTGNAGHAVALAEMATAREPLREAAHALLAEAQASSGDVVGALRTIDALRRRLRDEAGLDLSASILDLERRIQRGHTEHGPPQSAAGRPARPVFGGLPFVGRTAELTRILAAIGQTPPGVAVVGGPPGAGKSRLLQEAASRSAQPVIAVRAFQAERNEPWSLGRTVLREALSLDLGAAAFLADRTATALADLLPELEELRPLSTEAIDPESRRALALEGAVRLLSSAAGAGGLLLAVDDLQWADPTSLLLLGVIGRRLPAAALALSFRSTEVEPDGPLHVLLDDLRTVRGLTDVGVGPFSSAAIGELVTDSALADALVRHTDGTPLAVSEVIRRLADDGTVVSDRSGRWQSVRPDAGQLAESIAREGQRRAIERRAARRPPGERETLGLLALLGREVPARLIARARRCVETVVLDELDALARAGLVRLGEAGWAVAHDLIAESVAAALDREECGRLHHHLARTLADADADPAEVARHLAEAGDPAAAGEERGAGVGPRAAAAEAFAAAALQRIERYAADETATLADAGLALQPSGALRVTLLEHRAEARNMQGDGAGARHDLRCALDEMGTGPHRSRLLAKLAILSVSQDVAEAAALAEAAIAEAGSDPVARANALVSAGFAVGSSARAEEAKFFIDEARDLFEQLGDLRGMASTADAEANWLFFRGRLAEAAPLYRRAARLYRDTGQLAKAGWPMFVEAWALNMLGRNEAARERCGEALALERALGQLEGEAACLVALADVTLTSGDVRTTRQQLPDVIALCTAAGNRELISYSLILAGRVALGEGDSAAAETAFREALDTGTGLPLWQSQAAAHLAELHITRKDLDAADAFARQACGEQVGPGPFEGRMLLAEIACTRGDRGAEQQAREALQAAAATDYPPSPARLRLEQHLAASPARPG